MKLKEIDFVPTIVVGLARLASFFLLSSQKKETKEKATPSRLSLRCSVSWAAIKLTLTSHVKHDLLQGSNKRLPKFSMNLALLTAAAGGRVIDEMSQKKLKVFAHG